LIIGPESAHLKTPWDRQGYKAWNKGY